MFRVHMVNAQSTSGSNPLTAKLINQTFHPFEVVYLFIIYSNVFTQAVDIIY